MSYRGEARSLEEKVAALEEQLRRAQGGLGAVLVGADLTTLVATSQQVADAEMLGWLGMVMA